MGLHAASLEAFETIRERLMARGAADAFVTDFGPILSLFFTDPDGLEGEVCVENPDAVPGVVNPPGTPAGAVRRELGVQRGRTAGQSSARVAASLPPSMKSTEPQKNPASGESR